MAEITTVMACSSMPLVPKALNFCSRRYSIYASPTSGKTSSSHYRNPREYDNLERSVGLRPMNTVSSEGRRTIAFGGPEGAAEGITKRTTADSFVSIGEVADMPSQEGIRKTITVEHSFQK